MILLNIYKCDVCKKIRFGDLYISNSFICGKCYRKMKDEEKAHKRGQNQTETKCCALCKYWNYNGIQKYCFFERENLKIKERFDTCENFKDARKENELKRK